MQRNPVCRKPNPVAQKGHNFTIAVLATGDWEQWHRRPRFQALARQMESIGNIVCVQPYYFRPLVDWARGQAGRWLRWFYQRKPRRVGTNLYVFTPTVWIPQKVARIYGVDMQSSIARQVRRFCETNFAPGTRLVAWALRPEQNRMIDLLGADYNVYECIDDYTHDIYTGEPLPQLQAMEKESILKANLVFATQTELHSRLAPLHPNVLYAPNGVDFDLFHKATDPSFPIPPELERIPGPRIGYIGYISGALDYDILQQLASRHPDWSLVMVGPKEAAVDLSALSRLPNVHILGWKPYEEMPAYLKGFEVAIIPYKPHAASELRNPYKLWEYLAAGKPTVTVTLNETANLEDVVYNARDAAEFEQAIRLALKGDNTSRIPKGIELARSHSIDSIARDMVQALATGLEAKTTP